MRFVCGLLLSGCLTGCMALNPRPPVEMFVERFLDDTVSPAVQAGLANGVEQLTVSADAQLINPTYVTEFEGYWVVGVKGRASVGVEGVAGGFDVDSLSQKAEAKQEDDPPTVPGLSGRGAPWTDAAYRAGETE